MAKITKKQLSKFDVDLTHAKDCECSFSRINELVRLSFNLGDSLLNSKILDSLDRCYDDIYELILNTIPAEDEK